MNTQQKILNHEQTALVAELCETYGIEPDDIIFFSGDERPFLRYEAACVLSNRLVDLQNIELEPVPSIYEDSLSLKCNLTTSDGHVRSAVGVANVNEQFDGAKLSDQQLYQLASARAIRNALKTAGIDLIRLHYQSKSEKRSQPAPLRSNTASLLAQAHILGQKAYLICGDDKSLWYRVLHNRYGVERSSDLSDTQLADLVAFLRSLQPQSGTAKAAGI